MEKREEKEREILARGRKVAEEVLSLVKNKDGETSQLDEELKNNIHFKSYVDKISDEKSVKTICQNYNRKEQDSEVARFTATITECKRKLRRKTIAIWSSSAAAAVVAMSFIFFTFNDDNNKVTAKNEPAKELISSPTLISNDGEIIELKDDLNAELNLEKIAGNTQNTMAQASSESVEYSKIIIPSKYTYSITLSDGTKVMLNANSSLRFPKKFGADDRTVYLEGEAYFEVTKSTIPFYVNCDNLKLRVYGTQFNIKNCRTTEIVLVEGSVGVKTSEVDDEYMLKPSQCLTVKSDKVEILDVEVGKYLAWRNNCFVAESDKIAKLLADISQWYGVKFNDSNKINLNKKVTVQINRDMALDQLLEALSPILEVKFIKEKEGEYSIDKK